MNGVENVKAWLWEWDGCLREWGWNEWECESYDKNSLVIRKENKWHEVTTTNKNLSHLRHTLMEVCHGQHSMLLSLSEEQRW